MRYCPRCWWLFDMAAGALACYLRLSLGAPQTIRCAVGGSCGIHVAGGAAVSACELKLLGRAADDAKQMAAGAVRFLASSDVQAALDAFFPFPVERTRCAHANRMGG